MPGNNVCSIDDGKWKIGYHIAKKYTGNKLTGLLVFLMPLSVCVADAKYGAAVVCIAATITAIKEMVNQKEGHTL